VKLRHEGFLVGVVVVTAGGHSGLLVGIPDGATLRYVGTLEWGVSRRFVTELPPVYRRCRSHRSLAGNTETA
jgi:hypothetical protein